MMIEPRMINIVVTRVWTFSIAFFQDIRKILKFSDQAPKNPIAEIYRNSTRAKPRDVTSLYCYTHSDTMDSTVVMPRRRVHKD